MDIYKFVRMYEAKHPNSPYFKKETLKWWGERMSEMRILKKTVKIKDLFGVYHEAYVLSKVSRSNGVKYRNYDYFDVETLEIVD